MKQKYLKSLFFFAFHGLPDRLYTQLMYLFYFRRWPNFKNPNLYTEKIQALKLLPVHSLVAQCADKVTLRDYLASLDLQQHLTDVLDIADSLGDIRWYEYPLPYIVKISNASGHNAVIRSFDDIPKAIKQFQVWSNIDFSQRYRERYYRCAKQRFVIEPYIENLRDIRIHCFHGEPTFIAYSFVEITGNPKVMLDFNCQVEKYPFTRNYTIEQVPDIKDDLPELYQLAKKLSTPFTYVRVDTYRINNVIKIGEMTFTPLAGLALRDAFDVDMRWGTLMGDCSQWVR